MMSINPLESIISEENGMKIFRHSTKRKLMELFVLIFFLLIGILLIVFAIIFKDQGNFFKISLIVMGILIPLLFIESFITIILNRIILNETSLTMRNYFKWEKIMWNNITSIEVDKRDNRFAKEQQKSKLVILKIRTNDNEHYFPLYRFRNNEAEFILDTIRHYYQKCTTQDSFTKERDSLTDKEKASLKPISDEEITAKIPQKVTDNEIE